MSERQSRRFRQELRRRFKSDFDEFTNMVGGFSLWFRITFCLEIIFGRWWKKVKSKFTRKKRIKRGDK